MQTMSTTTTPSKIKEWEGRGTVWYFSTKMHFCITAQLVDARFVKSQGGEAKRLGKERQERLQCWRGRKSGKTRRALRILAPERSDVLHNGDKRQRRASRHCRQPAQGSQHDGPVHPPSLSPACAAVALTCIRLFVFILIVILILVFAAAVIALSAPRPVRRRTGHHLQQQQERWLLHRRGTLARNAETPQRLSLVSLASTTVRGAQRLLHHPQHRRRAAHHLAAEPCCCPAERPAQVAGKRGGAKERLRIAAGVAAHLGGHLGQQRVHVPRTVEAVDERTHETQARRVLCRVRAHQQPCRVLSDSRAARRIQGHHAREHVEAALAVAVADAVAQRRHVLLRKGRGAAQQQRPRQHVQRVPRVQVGRRPRQREEGLRYHGAHLARRLRHQGREGLEHVVHRRRLHAAAQV
eukprot:Rhum_TRINITY_DN15185_c15_g1::Rhum_TRINITY_DN15185_c15_g1_i1::g.142997::m.142997